MTIFLRLIACLAISGTWFARSAIVVASLASFNMCAQIKSQPSPAPPGVPSAAVSQQTQSGVETGWDARRIIDAIGKINKEMKPVLLSISPQEWYEKKGAPSTYVIQWQTAQRQVSDVDITAPRFAQKTDSLPLGLDLYFRLEALETTARSVDEGAKKYADPSAAAKLTALLAANFDGRQRLRDYLRDLAADQEQNFKIADAEAQRCRGMISREPAPSNNRKSKQN